MNAFRQLVNMFAKRFGRFGFILAIVTVMVLAVPGLAAARGFWGGFGYGGYNPPPYQQPTPTPVSTPAPTPVNTPSPVLQCTSNVKGTQYGSSSGSIMFGNGLSVNWSSANAQMTSLTATKGVQTNTHTNGPAQPTYTLFYYFGPWCQTSLRAQGAGTLGTWSLNVSLDKNGNILNASYYDPTLGYSGGSITGSASINPVFTPGLA